MGRSPIVYIYMLEMLTPAYQKIAGPIFAVSVALCLFIGTFLLQNVTNDTSVICYISLAMSFLTMLLVTGCIPESPKYLHATG